MIASRINSLVLSALLLAGMYGCSNAAQVAEYTKKAEDFVAKYSPQLAELQNQLPDLVTRVGAIPDEVPGAAELKGLLASSQETIAKLQARLASLPGQITTAVQERKTEEADAALASATQELDSGLASVQTALAGATKQVAELEAKAKEMAGFTKTMPSGFELHGVTDGVESVLIAFIEDTSQPIDKDTWFTFDRLTFQMGAAELDMEQSSEQITNIAEILKAYPTVKLKIGGYTDNTGAAAANKTLSKKRADAVVAAVVAAGGDKARLAAEGYGQEHPVCPANDTEECKAQNRRIDVNVVAR
jgi:outer membrane protein OmpA-like peptidoglycan-associated protein